MTPRVTVLTTMKDEGAFLPEWVAHHLALGAGMLVICTNDCSDGTDAMADRLQAMGLARHLRTRHAPGASIQRAAFRQARALPQVAGADWLYVCDADEFLVIKAGTGRFGDLLAMAGPDCGWISVPWRVFGSGGQLTFHEGAVTRQFTLCDAPARAGRPGATFAKSLFRMGPDVGRIGVHGPVAAAGRVIPREAPGGRRLAPDAPPMMVRADYSVAQVNHYALRSAESFLVKRGRGRVNHVGQDMGLEYWQRFDRNTTTDTAIRAMDAPAAEALAALMADPLLAGLHARAVDWHRQRIATLRADPDMAALLGRITAAAPAGGA